MKEQKMRKQSTTDDERALTSAETKGVNATKKAQGKSEKMTKAEVEEARKRIFGLA